MGLIHEKITAILNEIEAIAKDTKSKDGGINYSFRGVDDVYNKLHPLFKKHGVFLTQKIVSSDSMFFQNAKGNPVNKASITLEIAMIAQDGSFVTTGGYGEAYDHSDKASYKAQSMAMKYCLIQMFLIPTKEEKDVEHANIEPAVTDPKIIAVLDSIRELCDNPDLPTDKKELTLDYISRPQSIKQLTVLKDNLLKLIPNPL